MKKILLTITTIVVTMGLFIGCGKGDTSTTDNSKNNESNVVEEQPKENPSKRLEKLQPGVFKSDMAKAITKYETVAYEELARYIGDYTDEQVKVTVRINTISKNEDGLMELYGYTDSNKLYFFYYNPEDVKVNVIKDDVVTIYGRVDNTIEVTSTNGFGASVTEMVPGVELHYLLDNSYTKSDEAMFDCIMSKKLLCQYELVGEAKDFPDLVDVRRGYVFALTDNATGEYLDKYIVAENGILRYYQPTIDGLNINGEAYDFKNEKALWGAQ